MPSKKPAESELANVVHENIQILIKHRRGHEYNKSRGERFADKLTQKVGTISFALIQIGFILGWLLLNLNFVPTISPWDPFPFLELSTIGALEALLLSIFILISQNRAAELAERRADLDLQISLLAEHEITRLIILVDDISRHLNVRSSAQKNIDELKRDVSSEKVIHEIEKAERNEDL